MDPWPFGHKAAASYRQAEIYLLINVTDGVHVISCA